MSRKSLSVLLLTVLVLLALAACRGRGEDAALATPVTLPTLPATTVAPLPGDTATPLATAAAASATAPAAATATASVAATATASVAATATISSGPPPGGSARINFAPGATSAVVQSTLAAGGDGDTWLLNITAGQSVTIQTIANPPGHINVSLLDGRGGVLSSSGDTVGIAAVVPATGDYQINLATASGAPAVGYTLQIFIPPLSNPVTPTRIQFAPGQSSAQLNDTLAAGGDLNSYVLTVAAGQTMQVGVFASPPAATNIYIRDGAGQLVSTGTDMSGASATAATAGDYVIDISNFNAAPAVNYTLTVSVPPVAPPPPTTAAPTRISFGPGQTSAQFDGSVPAAGGASYILAVAAGQTIITDLNDNPPGNVQINVTDSAGNVLNFGRAPTSLGTAAIAAGDYRINLSTTAAGPVSYSLIVSVPPLPAPGPTRIAFAPGATSATVTGDLPFGGDQDTYVLTGGAGQVLNVMAGVNEATGWVRLYVYDAAGQIIGLGTDITGVSAPLASTGDYRIVIVSDPAAGPLSYALVVAIP